MDQPRRCFGLPSVRIRSGSLFTLALVYVVLNVTTKRAGNWYFGLAIGFTVTAAAFAVGNIPGGAFNSAVAIGASMIGMQSWSAIWLYSSRNSSQVG